MTETSKGKHRGFFRRFKWGKYRMEASSTVRTLDKRDAQDEIEAELGIVEEDYGTDWEAVAAEEQLTEDVPFTTETPAEPESDYMKYLRESGQL